MAGHQHAIVRADLNTQDMRWLSRAVPPGEWPDALKVAAARFITRAALIAACAASACGGSNAGTPVGPSGLSPPGLSPILPASLTAADLQELRIEGCSPTLLVGEQVVCLAVAHLKNGQTVNVTFYASWASTNPAVAQISGALVFAKSAGSTVLSVSFLGHTDSLDISVAFPEHDALRISGVASQGPFLPGSTATFWLGVVYTVASAPAGQLRLQVSDQNGAILTTPLTTVLRGAEQVILTGSVTIPQASTRVCPVAILDVGAATISEPSDTQRYCMAVTP